VLSDWVAGVMADSDQFFTPPPINDYTLGAEQEGGERALTFPSALTTPHPNNNIVLTRLFPARDRPGCLDDGGPVDEPEADRAARRGGARREWAAATLDRRARPER
jgi:hypothetical protein